MSIVHCSVPGEQSQAELGSAGQQQRSGQGPSMTGGLDPEWKELDAENGRQNPLNHFTIAADLLKGRHHGWALPVEHRLDCLDRLQGL